MKAKIILLVLLIFIFVACAPTATPTEESATQSPEATEAASVTEPPVVETSTLEPTPSPSLKVGDQYYHIDGTTLVAVPAGDFRMGGDGSDNPVHDVTLHDYWIYSTKVTNQQYALCVQLGKCTPPDPADNPGYSEIQHANDPVTGVTYEQAAGYCSFAGGRLPTEAEWEKAADDPQGGEYPWGEAQPTCDLANFAGCGDAAGNVTKFLDGASYYGVLGMVGNAFEWVADWYDDDYYKNSPVEDPTGPEDGSSRVVRSSGFDSAPDQLATTNRTSEDPLMHRSNLGFRCVVDKPDQFAPVCESPALYGAEAATSTCPTLEITQVELCAKNFPYTNVSVSGATGVTINSEGCTLTDDPASVSCQPPSTVSAAAQCQVDLSGDPTCQTGYSFEGNTCVADGVPGTCPAGLNFDSAGQCCGLPSGPDATIKNSICPVGTFYIASQNACLPRPVKELVTVSVDVTFKSCAAQSGGGGTTSSCKEYDCGPSAGWLPARCCCSFDGTTCGF